MRQNHALPGPVTSMMVEIHDSSLLLTQFTIKHFYHCTLMLNSTTVVFCYVFTTAVFLSIIPPVLTNSLSLSAIYSVSIISHRVTLNEPWDPQHHPRAKAIGGKNSRVTIC